MSAWSQTAGVIQETLTACQSTRKQRRNRPPCFRQRPAPRPWPIGPGQPKKLWAWWMSSRTTSSTCCYLDPTTRPGPTCSIRSPSSPTGRGPGYHRQRLAGQGQLMTFMAELLRPFADGERPGRRQARKFGASVRRRRPRERGHHQGWYSPEAVRCSTCRWTGEVDRRRSPRLRPVGAVAPVPPGVSIADKSTTRGAASPAPIPEEPSATLSRDLGRQRHQMMEAAAKRLHARRVLHRARAQRQPMPRASPPGC